MAALLQLLTVVSSPIKDPAVPAINYYFLGTPNVYTSDIATATGVTVADVKLHGLVPKTSVKELLLAGVLKTIEVEVKKGNTIYRKKLRYAETVDATVAAGVIGKSWPTGTAQGGSVQSVLDPRRVVSRK